MANIQQAAKWMQEGKRVRRKHLASGISLGRCGLTQEEETVLFSSDVIAVYVDGARRAGQDWAPISCEDLLADDWEIAE